MNSRIFIFGFLAVLIFSSLSWAETTCKAEDCGITITIKIAFSGATDAYINSAKSEIESVWNNGNPTFGDCKCPITIKVETKKTADCKNNPPAGYHCISVTDYNNNPPRNQTNWTGATFYIGYMYGIPTGNGGNSEKGWWSSIMSRPVDPNNQQGEHYKDFAHEAGHMMGLEDGDGGLMNQTSGANSNPTQAHYDEIVNEICGANACPNKCCCGNGQIDRNVGEQCDPMAGGCPSDQYCCPGCCQCYGKICFPEFGEYLSESECRQSCGANAKCYYNYQTGCWDCVQNIVVVTQPPYDPAKVQQITTEEHERDEGLVEIERLFNEALLKAPTLKDFLGNEKVNIVVIGEHNYYVLIEDDKIYRSGAGLTEDPTVLITTDTGTLDEINAGTLNPLEAYKTGRITIEGVGFVNGIKYWFAEFMVDTFAPTDAVPNLAPQEVPEEPVERVVDSEIDEIREPVPPKGGEFPEGEIPETVLIVHVEEASEFYFDGGEVYNG